MIWKTDASAVVPSPFSFALGAMKGEGLFEGLDWLAENLKK